MTASTDQMLEHLRQKVFALIGKCILNLQLYEHRLKALLPALEITISPEGKLAQRDLSMSTLGGLIGEFTSKAISPEGSTPEEQEPKLDGKPSFLIKARFGTSYPQERYERIREDLATLLEQRNFLVHHFQAKYPLADSKDCQAAEAFLQELNRRALNSLSELKGYSGGLSFIQAAMADPNVSCRVFQVAPKTKQEWETIREVQALRDAEQLKEADGFTSLERAVLSIRGEIAEDAYTEFGLSSWQQFVQESRLFELVKRKNPETQRWERWYKSKE